MNHLKLQPFTFLSILLLTTNLSFGQKDSIVRTFVITPPNGTLQIQESYFDLSKENQPVKLKLPAGEYPVKIWAPYMNLHYDTLNFNSDSTSGIRRIKLTEYDPNFLEYKTELDAYDTKRKMKWMKYTSIGVVNVGLTATCIYLYRGIQSDISQLEIIIENHPDLIQKQNIELSRSQHKTLKEDIKRKETILYAAAIPLTIISYAVSTVAVIKISKQKLIEPDPFVPINPLPKGQDKSIGGHLILKTSGASLALQYTF